MATLSDSWRSGGTGTGAYILQSRTTGEIPLIARGIAGQTANIFAVQNSAGTNLFTVDPSGNVAASGTITITINEAVTGNATVTGNLSVTGTSTLTGAVTMGSTLNATGNIITTGSFQATANLTLGGISSVAASHLRLRTAAPSNIGSNGILYGLAGDPNTTELWYRDAAGNDVQITDAGALEGASFFWDDDEYIRMGNTAAAPDVRMGWNTAQTVDGWYFGTADGQNTLIIAENGDRAFDFAHGAATNPTLFIHSAAQATNQWISFAHDQTNALIGVGLGDLILTIPGGNLLPSANDAWAIGASGTGVSDVFLASGAIINFNAGDVTVTHSLNTLAFAGASVGYTFDSIVTIGAAGVATGQLQISGTTSGTVTVTTAAAAGTWTMTLPTNDGDASQFLQTNGSGVTSWATVTVPVGADPTASVGLTAVNGVATTFMRSDAAPPLSQAIAPTWTAAHIWSGSGLRATFTNTNDGASSQVAIFQGDRATMADNDEAYLTLRLSDDAGTQTETARITWVATDVNVATSVDGELRLAVMTAGVLANEVNLSGANFYPSTNDGNALGISGTAWSDLFLASGGVINWFAGDVTITHSANLLAFAGASSGYTFDAVINSNNATSSSITLQTQTFTAGIDHSAVLINPTWAAEDFEHRAINITPTQNGANASNLIGVRVFMTKATGASILATMAGVFVAAPTVTGTVTNSFGIDIAAQNNASITTSRALRIEGISATNAIVMGSDSGAAPLIYGNAAEQITFADSTNADGLRFVLSATNSSIRTVGTGDRQIRLQDQTFTAGATHEAVLVSPTWATENFRHIALDISPTQNGANSNGQGLNGIRVAMTKATGATTLFASVGLYFEAPVFTGTVTFNYGIYFNDNTAGGGTSRGIVFGAYGVANGIQWNSALQYGSAAETIRFTDSTNVDGLNFVLSTTNSSIRTVGTGDRQIRLQDQTFTTGAAHEAVLIAPTWATENFNHYALSIQPTQNSGNTQTMRGLEITMTQAVGGTLTNASHVAINTPTQSGSGGITGMSGLFIQDISLAGGSTSYAIDIQAQSANATTTRAILIEGSGIANSIRLGNSPNIYSSAANVIRFSDATDARSLVFTLTAAGAQTIGTSAGNMELAVAGTSEVTLTSTNFQPTTNDGNALGVSGTAWADLFLASGSIIDFASGDVTITHATDRLTFGGSVVNLLVNATPDDLYGNVMSLFVSANYVSQYTQSNSISSAYWTGFYSEPENTSTNPGSTKYMVGFVAAPETSATSGTLGGLYGFIVRGAAQGAGGTVTDLVGYAMENGITTGTITNQYGIKLNRLSAGSTLNRGYHQDLQTTGTMVQLSADSAVTLTGTALTGMNVDFNASVTATTDVDVTGYALLTPALTQSAANTTNFRGFNLPTAGALVQDTAAGTLDWRGANIQMPNITQTTGTVQSYGVYVNGGTVTSGTQYAVFVDSGNSRFDGRVLQTQGADVASATSLTLGNDGNAFEITGTTTVDQILTTGWQEGAMVTLIFNESVTVRDAIATSGANVTILLDGSANFSATADDTLTLILSSTTAGGQAWREVSRAVI